MKDARGLSAPRRRAQQPVPSSEASSAALAGRADRKVDGPSGGFRTPVRSLLLLVPGQAIGQVVAFVVLVLVARAVGPSNFGAYQFAVSALAYFSLFANLGIVTLGVRDVTADLEPRAGSSRERSQRSASSSPPCPLPLSSFSRHTSHRPTRLP